MREEFANPESAEYPKPHFTGSYEIAQEVCTDLDERFGGGMRVESVEDLNKCFWDPGGMLFVDDEVFDFNLGSITISCYSQHYFNFISQLSKRHDEPLRGTDEKYVKLHGEYLCICLTPEEFDALYEMVVSEEKKKYYSEKANNSIDEKLKRIKQVNDHLQQDAELNLLADSVDMEDKKNLN